jgi:hypothetical protein
MSRFLHLAKQCTKAITKLYDAVPSSSPISASAIGTPPAITYRCRATVANSTTHTDCAGTLTIGSDVLTFTTSGQIKICTTNITASTKPAISYSGLDCKITIECIDAGGAPIYTTTETDLRCKIEIKTKNIPSPAGGWTSIQATEMQARGTFAIGDVIKFDIDAPFDPTDGIEYQIVAIRPKVGYMGKENIKILTF